MIRTLTSALCLLAFSATAQANNDRCDKQMFGGAADVRECTASDGWATFAVKWIDDCEGYTTVDLKMGYTADKAGETFRVVGSTLSTLTTTYNKDTIESTGEIFSTYEPNNKNKFTATMDLLKNELTITSGFGANVKYPSTFQCNKVK